MGPAESDNEGRTDGVDLPGQADYTVLLIRGELGYLSV
jgi:hypothetical protein